MACMRDHTSVHKCHLNQFVLQTWLLLEAKLVLYNLY